MKKILQIAVLILCVSSLARAQQKQSLSAAAATCTTTGTSCLITSVDPQAGGVTLTVTTNASGNTLQFEASGDGGTTWVALNATPSNSTTAATSTTSTGTWQANIAAYTNVRIRMSTLVSGTSTVSIIYSIASARAGGGGGGGGGVTSFSGDGTVITNSASTGAVTATIAGTSGGIPCFNSATTWQSSGAIAAGVLVKGGGAGACAGSSTLTDNGTAIVGTEPLRLGLGSVSAPSYSFSSSTTDGMYERSAAILDFGIGGSNPVFEMFTVSGGGARFPVGFPIGWSSTAAASGAYDTAISRDSAGVVDIGNGTAADKTGTLIAA